MSYQDPLSSFFAKEMQIHAARTPPQKAVARTSYGSLLLVACAYTAFELGPDALNQYPTGALYGFAAVAGFGLLLFIVGLRGPRFPAEFMTRFWSLFWAAAFGAGSWWLAVNQPGVWEIFWVRCFCLSFAVAQGLEFLLMLRPMPSGAETLVNQNIAANEFNWD